MTAHSSSGPVGRLTASLILVLAAGPALADEPAEIQAVKKASAEGKYGNLLAVIHAPGDKEAYGEFNDFGPYEGSEWAGYGGLPKGVWVYVHPHWYIWQKDGKSGENPPLAKASVDGKYSKLLAVIRAPADKEVYGEFNDYGPFEGSEWAGYTGLPKGNWVYVAPHWYIWEKEGKDVEAPALKKATADGKYAKLLAVIHAPDDKDSYGEFNDYGPYDGSEWAGYTGLPKGNWVYVAPHWYIWEKEGKDDEPLPLKKAAADGKYSKLLAVIHAPDDKSSYGDFNDYGPYEGSEWAGYGGLPTGNWVYVYPHWYIWETTKP
jgi:hypothetical protein